MLLASLAAVAAKPVYKIELVPTQNDMRPLFPEKINNAGVVFGRARDVDNRRHLSLFQYEQGTMHLIPDSAHDIPENFNDAGDMLVQVENGAQAVYWHDGRREQLSTFRFADDINNHGDIAGQGIFNSGFHAAILANGVLTDLGTLGGDSSYASELSDSGYAAGSSEVPGSKPGQLLQHAFIWFGGQIKDLGTFGGTDSYTYGLNDLGHVIGMADDEGHDGKAFFYDGVQMRRLPFVAPDMVPMAINNHDEIAGISDKGAFITTGGRSYLLKDLLKGGDGWASLDEALSINDAGDVLGIGHNGGHRATYIARRVKP